MRVRAASASARRPPHALPLVRICREGARAAVRACAACRLPTRTARATSHAASDRQEARNLRDLKLLLVTAPPTEAGDDQVVYIKAYANPRSFRAALSAAFARAIMAGLSVHRIQRPKARAIRGRRDVICTAARRTAHAGLVTAGS